jgi:hypothetical protein
MLTANSDRGNKLIDTRGSDVFKARGNPPEPTVCDQCGSVFKQGRWTWSEQKPEQKANAGICPACRRTSDNIPAGEVEISGPFYLEHSAEIQNRILNIEESEKHRHPLERIIAFEPGSERLRITTTGVHLARRIGEGLRRSCKGELSLTYAYHEHSVRVQWNR